MASILLVVLCVSAVFGGHLSAADSDSTCVGTNEQWSDCPRSTCASKCPTSEEEVKSCMSSPCPEAGCDCLFNYRRLSNGTCVPTRECPPFDCPRSNEQYDPCPPLCPNGDCSQATPDGSCPALFGHIGIVNPCSPQCRCVKGYWRKNGVCVPYDQC